jgi:hypothetical protein
VAVYETEVDVALQAKTWSAPAFTVPVAGDIKLTKNPPLEELHPGAPKGFVIVHVNV